MNILPDTLKLNYEPEPEPAPVAEPNIKEVISEAGEIIDSSIPLDTDDDAEQTMNELSLPTFVPKPSPNISLFEEKSQVKQPVYEQPKSEVKLTKKGKPRKPMSEEHKAKLAIAREKANAKKRYLKDLRDKAKAEAKVVKQSDVLPEIKVVAEPVVRPQTPQPTPEPEPPKVMRQSHGITLEDLEKAQLNTILTIEKMRKDRKTEKKKLKLEEEYKQDTMKTIKKINNWQETAGIYQNCF